MSTMPITNLPDPVISHDHGPTIIIAAGITFGCAITALTMRLHQLWPWTSLLKREDLLLIISVVGVHLGFDCSRRVRLIFDSDVRNRQRPSGGLSRSMGLWSSFQRFDGRSG